MEETRKKQVLGKTRQSKCVEVQGRNVWGRPGRSKYVEVPGRNMCGGDQAGPSIGETGASVGETRQGQVWGNQAGASAEL